MRLVKTAIPITCTPVSPGTNRLATSATMPITLRAMPTLPKRLPKPGALCIATPSTMKQIVMKRLPTKKNVLVIPWVVCHRRTAVACVLGVALEIDLGRRLGRRRKSGRISKSSCDVPNDAQYASKEDESQVGSP